MKTNFIHKCFKHGKWITRAFYDYCRLMKILNSESVVLISHNADDTGGAPVVLFNLAVEMRKKYDVFFVSDKPGAILEQCQKQNIPNFVSYCFESLYIKLLIKKKVKFVIVNTLASYRYIEKINRLDSNIPFAWWIHEESNLVKKYARFIPIDLKDNIQIIAVSSRVKMDLEKLGIIKTDIPIIYYGCKDISKNDVIYTEKGKRISIISVGRLCGRKNQVELVEAYNRLPQSYKEKVYIKFIYGSFENEYNDYLRNRIDMISENDHFEFRGQVSREQMPLIYHESDLLVCTSNDDPLPVVVTEAMMYKLPVITSSGTGQYNLIRNGIDGFIYQSGNIEELVDRMIKAITSSKDDINKICNNARCIYENNFSPEVPVKRFEHILKGV